MLQRQSARGTVLVLIPVQGAEQAADPDLRHGSGYLRDRAHLRGGRHLAGGVAREGAGRGSGGNTTQQPINIATVKLKANIVSGVCVTS